MAGKFFLSLGGVKFSRTCFIFFHVQNIQKVACSSQKFYPNTKLFLEGANFEPIEVFVESMQYLEISVKHRLESQSVHYEIDF